MSEMLSGAEVLLEVLATEGVRHIFGNPGTTELPLMAALSGDDRFEYVLSLHESVSAGMADGYAQTKGTPSFVNLHVASGLGNAMGNLSNSRATRTPIVVTAGQQDQRHLMAEPFLSGPLTEMAGGLMKWVHEVRRAEDLGLVLRRAFHDAASPPSGPVFVSIPLDVLGDRGAFSVPAASRLERRSVPARLAELASALLDSPRSRLAIVAGDEVARSGAVGGLVKVAERLGCVVYGTPNHSNLVFPTDHALWGGALPPDAAGMNATLSDLHTVLLIGSRGFMTFGYQDLWPVPTGLRLVHLSPAAEDLGRTYQTALGLVGDPAATLEALLPLLTGVEADEVAALVRRAASRSADRAATLERRAEAALGDDRGRMHPLAAVRSVLSALPPETTVVDEAVTSDPYIRALHAVHGAGRFLYSRGGGLGWGLPAALGVSLARDRQPVVSITGDGSFLYSPQALWSAVRERLPVVAVVLDNRGYLILRRFLAEMRGGETASARDVGVDISDPSVDLVSLARGFGVKAFRVDDVADVGDHVREALASGQPCLLDVPVSAPPAG